MKTILWALGILLLGYIAIRLWMWLVDTFFKGLQCLNPFRKKNTIHWHTLEEDAVQTTEIKKQTTEYIDDSHSDII